MRKVKSVAAWLSAKQIKSSIPDIVKLELDRLNKEIDGFDAIQIIAVKYVDVPEEDYTEGGMW